MKRILAYLLGMALFFLLSTCDIVYAQNLPNQLKAPSFQNTCSKSNQTQKSSQKNQIVAQKKEVVSAFPSRNETD